MDRKLPEKFGSLNRFTMWQVQLDKNRWVFWDENFEGEESVKDIQLNCVQLVSNMMQLADCSVERFTVFCPKARIA